MGNRQINHYAFGYQDNVPNVYCDTVLTYDTIDMKILSSIDDHLAKSSNSVLQSSKDFILTAMAYLIRENKNEYASTYTFYKTGTLILKIIRNPNKIEYDTNTSYVHIRCDLDILFASAIQK